MEVHENWTRHIILLQGDEPLLLPNYIDDVVNAITKEPEGDAWNATGPIESIDEIDRHFLLNAPYHAMATSCFNGDLLRTD